ncbi:MAG: mucoidy inhibitor MuiA family protein [Lachnospiraceae bacterium]|nr:mucoidy inhibitor MuiA family protein [Lachnospiraceae bacterium]
MVETKLTAAAVYRGGCVVRRSGRVFLQKGTQTVRIGGLTAGIDESTLRLSVPAGVSGSNVQVEHPTHDEQREALKELTAKIAAVQSRIQSREKIAALWEANADFSQKESLSIDEMAAYLEKLPERLEALNGEITALREEKAALDKELAEAKKKAGLPYVTAELSTQEAGEYPLEISCREQQAFWNPVYEIHADSEKDSLDLRLRAKIFQRSGEDWNDVKLTLFSGNPSVSGTIPEMDPVHLRFYEPPVYKNRAAGGARLGGMMKAARADDMMLEESEAMEDAAAPMMVMNAVYAGSGTATKGETMTEYALSGSWDIRDGQEIICDIKTDALPCRYHAVAVPKLSDEAYLAAEVATSLLEDLQDTPAAVYLKGAFAGSVVLEPDMTRENYDLSLGVDETVKVKREQKKKYTSNVLLKGQKKTEYEYEITVSSRKDREISVTVSDQLPISDEKTIVIEPLELSGAEREEEKGFLRWTFKLAPGETKTVRLAWTVAWPKDKRTEEV